MKYAEPKGAYTDLHQLIASRQSARGLALFQPRRALSQLAGSHTSRIKGRGMEFAEVRPYQPGDDVRSIDWRVTARTQKPHTKLFTEERLRPVFFLVDQRASMFFGSKHCFKSVYASHLAALFSWVVSDGGDRVGGMIAHTEGVQDDRAQSSQHAALAFIRRLHLYNHQLKSPEAQARECSLAKWLSDARRAVKPGATLIVISDFLDWNQECEKTLHLLSRHNELLLFQIHDPLERQWPADDALWVSANGTRFGLSKQRAQQLSQHWLTQQQAVATACARSAIRYFLLDTQTPLTAFAQQHFGRIRK